MQSQQSQKLLGCDYITKMIKRNLILGDHFERILLEGLHTANSISLGTKPSRFPNPSLEPIQVVANPSPILEVIAGLPLTWVEIKSLSQWGVYHNYMALFGERHWVAQDRSGATLLYQYDGAEHFI